MRNALRREWARWQQERAKQRQQQDDLHASHEPSALPWLDRLRWWLLPLLLLFVLGLSWLQLHRLTQPKATTALPIILDAPLQSPYRLGWTSHREGHYFRLRSKGLEGRFVAYDPGPRTRAYLGNDAVAIFGAHQPHAEITPSSCDATPQDDITFVTGDGLMLRLCQDPKDETRFALRRMGWRFSQQRWQQGLSLGKSAKNDIVLGSSLLPSHALSLQLRGRRLHVTPSPKEATLPIQHRLLCVSTASPQRPDTSGSLKATKAPKRTASKAKATPAATAQPPQGDLPCGQAAFFLEPGQQLRLHSKHHPAHAVTLLWHRSHQEKGAFDLRITPADGPGMSQRRLSLASLKRRGASDFLIGNPALYFNGVRPDAVRTQDLDELVHELLLRRVLQYAGPEQLRAMLRSRYQGQLSLEQLAQNTPMDLWLPQLEALSHNRYLRNRLWLVNRSLAQRYKLQARTLFRIRFPRGEQPGALLGLGHGGATVRAPRQHLLHARRERRQPAQDLRLTTSLTTNGDATPYLQRLDAKGKAIPGDIVWLTSTPVELIGQPGEQASTAAIPRAVGDRQFKRLNGLLLARTILWRGGRAYGSHHPYAYQAKAAAPNANAGGKPSRFMHQLTRRWWKRSPGLQRSSADWPLSAIAAKLGTLLTQERLQVALQRLNPAPSWQKKRRHCGNQSKKEGKRWRHKHHCWGDDILIKQGTRFLVPCNELIRSKLREAHCRPGVATPQIDAQGRPLLPIVKAIDGMYGVALLAPQAKGQTRPTHQLQLLPGSLPVKLDERTLLPGQRYSLREDSKLQLGAEIWQYKHPSGLLATARFRGEYIAPHYPEGATFAHAIAGGVGGPFRNVPKALATQLPPAPAAKASTKKRQPKGRRIATTLSADLQRAAYSVASRHFARLDSPSFQKRFRRRYITNPHKPHAGAVVILNRRTGAVLTSLSFPTFDPNLPALQSQLQDDQRTYRYLRGQIVDRYGMTDALIAYHPSRLPPTPPARKRLQGRPDAQPDYLQALRWDREEELRGIRGTSRSGWLLERAFGGGQTPGSTAKLVTAAAYARYLRRKGRPVRFPKHNCAGGLMFMRQRGKQGRSWRPSTLRFRCHKRQGHGHVGLKQAMASSCNVYFAKLALEMAGVDQALLRKGKVQWLRNRHGGQGKYQSLQIPRNTLSDAMRRDPAHRSLFRTAAQLGFAMRYTYRRAKQKRQYARYTDAFWEAPMTPWATPPSSLKPNQRIKWLQQQREKRRKALLPGGSFGQGRFFGYAAAYPAWQQWVHGATDPRHRRPTSVQRAFGSTDASLRAMAYVGFGQGLIATPLRLALLGGAIANGGWLPLPQLWRGDWDGTTPPSAPTAQAQRAKPKRVLHAADAKLLQQALAAVTTYGTASQPFAQLNKQCLMPMGLQLIGKTGTAENRSQRARARLRERVKRAGKRHRLPTNRRQWLRESGCHRRTFWRHYSPEENIADSLFVGAILPHGKANAATDGKLTGKGWRLQDLSFAVVVKNGYHPEGAPCRRGGRDLDRSEARYLAHDVLLAAIQSLGACRDYKDKSRPAELLKAPKSQRRSRPRRRRRGQRRSRPRRRRRSQKRRRRRARRKRQTRRRTTRPRKRRTRPRRARRR